MLREPLLSSSTSGPDCPQRAALPFSCFHVTQETAVPSRCCYSRAELGQSLNLTQVSCSTAQGVPVDRRTFQKRFNATCVSALGHTLPRIPGQSSSHEATVESASEARWWPPAPGQHRTHQSGATSHCRQEISSSSSRNVVTKETKHHSGAKDQEVPMTRW